MLRKREKDRKSYAKPLVTSALISLSCFTLQALRGVIASTGTLPISVRLIRAVEITLATSLDFGTLAMTLDRAGTARMDTSLNRLIIDNNSSLALAGGTPQVGRFTISGSSFPVTISMKDTSVQLTNGVESLTVNGFNLMTENGGSQITVTPQLGQNSFTVPVGASLIAKPGQLDGTYIGTTRIFANFQ